jgi:hypothetical protein
MNHMNIHVKTCRGFVDLFLASIVTIGVLTTGPRLQDACNDTFLQPNYYTYSNSDQGVLDVTRPQVTLGFG